MLCENAPYLCLLALVSLDCLPELVRLIAASVDGVQRLPERRRLACALCCARARVGDLLEEDLVCEHLRGEDAEQLPVVAEASGEVVQPLLQLRPRAERERVRRADAGVYLAEAVFWQCTDELLDCAPDGATAPRQILPRVA
jgi:hypothetical protein